jgi:type I restriction enzyme R subunit
MQHRIRRYVNFQKVDISDYAGGLGKMWQLFGEKTDDIINELNEVLTA